MTRLKVVDLYSGMGGMTDTHGGWGDAFRRRGHKVVTIDWEAKFEPDIVADVFTLRAEEIIEKLGATPDIVLASPPCECFSVASISTHWTGGSRAYVPRDDKTRQALRLVQRTLELITELNPRMWIVENPRGVMRKIEPMSLQDRVTVTYCQYGESRMKPTDIWGGHPDTWRPRPMCKNGDPCHERAPRGAKTGTQGIKGSAARAIIPYQLSYEMCLAAESFTGRRPLPTLRREYATGESDAG